MLVCILNNPNGSVHFHKVDPFKDIESQLDALGYALNDIDWMEVRVD